MNTQNQLLESPQPQSNRSINSKSFKLPNRHIILIIILCIVSLGSVIYLLTIINAQKNILESPYVRVILPIKNLLKSFVAPTISPTPTIDITNWITLVSQKYGYSIKYPNNWTAKITDQQDPKILEYVVFDLQEATISNLAITLSYSTRTYKEVLNLDPQPSEKITVASVSATKRNHQDSDGNVSINVIIPYKANTIIISAKEKYKDILNQMLSSISLP